MHEDLIRHFLKHTSQNQDIYPLLANNLDKLDRNFALGLREFAKQEFVKQPASAIKVARVIVKLSSLIQRFEQGNPASNLEIAIAGYESALTVITHETFPQGWVSIQQTLVSVYQQRQDILSTTINELKENTVKTQTQINDLTEKFRQEKQQSCELKAELLKVMESPNHSAPVIDLQSLVSAIQETKLPTEQFNTVIFYDIENLTLGNSNPQFNFSLTDIIGKVKGYNLVNQIAGQYAYADWSDSRLKPIRRDIQQFGIETMQIFDFNGLKNAADIQLVIDAVELIHSKPSLQVFVIVSGDGGFSCLAKKLHEYGKIVIGCGYDNHTNSIFTAVCDYFVRLPDPVQRTNGISNSTTTVGRPQRRNNI
ncbi:NYN domain-containing protein [Rivularia sp. UHCC 0363]|uniref:NYN domain-containing protein n=1 Tax=Rivularia sp. UHCC 0363 TaxID=3110244 RepID=UPI002B212BBA|nr:NYN domain-containing protein [Rivularia sp. UHCC 0363]MEA5597176.1 NYN domain-containing protein [Rivularia sp. UHCC 0363]